MELKLVKQTARSLNLWRRLVSAQRGLPLTCYTSVNHFSHYPSVFASDAQISLVFNNTELFVLYLLTEPHAVNTLTTLTRLTYCSHFSHLYISYSYHMYICTRVRHYQSMISIISSTYTDILLFTLCTLYWGRSPLHFLTFPNCTKLYILSLRPHTHVNVCTWMCMCRLSVYGSVDRAVD